MARSPYHIARQQHLGDALDDLTSQGMLDWQWDYADRRAIYRIRKGDGVRETHDTRSAEQLVQAQYDELGTRWKAVPHPGGEKEFAETVAWIAGAGL